MNQSNYKVETQFSALHFIYELDRNFDCGYDACS